jgi:hypothetical protein
MSENVGFPVSLMSWPCILVMVFVTCALTIFGISAFRMGQKEKDPGGNRYLRAFMAMTCGIVSMLIAIGLLKFLE